MDGTLISDLEDIPQDTKMLIVSENPPSKDIENKMRIT